MRKNIFFEGFREIPKGFEYYNGIAKKVGCNITLFVARCKDTLMSPHLSVEGNEKSIKDFEQAVFESEEHKIMVQVRKQFPDEEFYLRHTDDGWELLIGASGHSCYAVEPLEDGTYDFEQRD